MIGSAVRNSQICILIRNITLTKHKPLTFHIFYEFVDAALSLDDSIVLIRIERLLPTFIPYWVFPTSLTVVTHYDDIAFNVIGLLL